MKCGHCKSDHRYAFQVRQCQERQQAEANRVNAQYRNTPNSVRKPTENQIKYITDLAYKKGMKGLKLPETFSQASRTIDYLKKQPDQKNPERPGPVISYVATNIIKDGRYAVQVDPDNKQYAFIRVSRPKTGSYRGKLVVQSQHSDDLVRRLVFDEQGRTVFQNTRPIAGQSLADILSSIIVDQKKAAFDYADQKNVCCRCGKQLTDARSAYLGCGPECEKYMPGYVEYVEDMKGAFIK